MIIGVKKERKDGILMKSILEPQKHMRNEYIDLLKSFLIITVVLGHMFVAFFPETYIFRWDFKIIYSFHMFLFIFISGYLVEFVNHTINFMWIKQRCIRLILPYSIWTLIFYLLHGNRVSFFGYFMELIAPSFWFLIILFLCDGMYYIITNIFVSLKSRLYTSIVLVVFIMMIWWSTKNIIVSTDILHMYSIYLPFYFLGVFSAVYQDKMVNFIRRFGIILCLLYPLAMFLYTYQNHDFFISFVNEEILNKCGYYFSRNILNTISVMYNHFVVAPLGMVFWGMMIYKIYQLKFVNIYFSYIGKYTLGIYILGGLFFFRYTGIVVYDLIISTILGIFLPIFFEKILLKIAPKIHWLLFGTYH